MREKHPLIRASNLLVHCFARQRVEWQRIDGGKWRSPGGRVLSDEAYQRHLRRLGNEESLPVGSKYPHPSVFKGLVNQGSGAETTQPAAPQPGAPAPSKLARKRRGVTVPESERGHNVRLPKDPRRLLIDQADAALKQMGYTVGESTYSLKLKTPLTHLTHPDGRKSIATGDEIRSIVYGPAEKRGSPAPAAPAPVAPVPQPVAQKAPTPTPKPAPAAAKPAPKTQPPKPPAPKPTPAVAAVAPARPTAAPAPAAPPQPPAKPARPKNGPDLPAPSPADSSYINAAAVKDKQRFGPKVAEFLRKSLATAVGILTATNGLAWGAITGTALGGPLGLALGTAVGGSIGARLGAWAGKKTDRKLGGKRFSERFADTPGAPPHLDPVALIKARIRALLVAQGKPVPQIDDEPILAALALAAQEDDENDTGAKLTAMSEACRELCGAARKV